MPSKNIIKVNKNKLEKKTSPPSKTQTILECIINKNSALSNIICLPNLVEIMNSTKKLNPYNSGSLNYTLWNEQCFINFPLLYLSSIFLYIYAKERNIKIFLFATRDCCFWIKIFIKMFPEFKDNCHYFHSSRNVFKKAIFDPNTQRNYNNYVKNLIKTPENIEKTIYVDIHGTGQHISSYFLNQFDNFPYCFIISAACENYSQLPYACQPVIDNNKMKILTFGAGGSPIEMLNYDIIGTLNDFSKSGPIRGDPEYDPVLLEPYHISIDTMISSLDMVDIHLDDSNKLFSEHNVEILNIISSIYDQIRNKQPLISQLVRHHENHKLT
jgi:hypothetical protein